MLLDLWPPFDAIAGYVSATLLDADDGEVVCHVLGDESISCSLLEADSEIAATVLVADFGFSATFVEPEELIYAVAIPLNSVVDLEVEA